ncbi:MAG: hypothetical protein ACTSYS_15915, partial [Promethearchaeota archaeon]
LEQDRKRDEYNNLESSVRSLKSVLDQLDKRKNEILDQLKKIEAREKKVKELRGIPAIIEKYEKVKVLLLKRTPLQEGLAGLSKRAETLTLSIKTTEAAMQEAFHDAELVLKKKVADVDDLKETLEYTTMDLEETLAAEKEKEQDILNNISEIKGQIKENEELFAQLESSGDQCPVCKSPLTPEHVNELTLDYRTTIDSLQDEIKNLQKKRSETTKKVKILDAKLKKIQNINISLMEERLSLINKDKRELASLENELAEKRKKIDEINEIIISLIKVKNVRLEDVNKKLNNLKKAKEEMDRYQGEINQKENLTRDLNDVLKQIKENEDKLSEHEEKLQNLKYDPKFHEKIKMSEEKATDAFNEYQQTIGNLEGKQAQLKDELKRISVETNENRKKLDTFKKYERFVEFLKKIRNIFHRDRLQKRWQIHAKKTIEFYAKKFFEDFNFPFSNFQIDDDFSVILSHQTASFSTSMLSGGERTAAALALRLGITRALTGGNMTFLILDEPTTFLDDDRRKDLINIIGQSISIPQLILVTHVQEMENSARNILYIQKSDKNISKIDRSRPS